MPESIGELIKRLSDEAGYKTLGQLYRDSGVSVATLSRVVRGKEIPTPATLKKLAPFLRVCHDTLMVVAGHLDPKKNGRPMKAENDDVMLINIDGKKYTRQELLRKLRLADSVEKAVDNAKWKPEGD